MRASYIIVLIFSLLTAGVYWYQSEALVCPVPLSYRVGEIDSSFSLSKEEAIAHVQTAELFWEEGVNRELFIYDASSDFTIDFIFDERQAEADQESLWRSELDKKRDENKRVLNTVESLQLEYESLSKSYEQKASLYEEKLSEYNAEVSKYNDRGGAPSDIFAELEEKREVLNDEAAELNRLNEDLESLAAEINELSEAANQMVSLYNKEVDNYNGEYGFSREFTQGDYQGYEINIYKFSSDAELVNVLVHEFGHALGIGHVEDESAVMYYLMEDAEEDPVLSMADLQAYYEVCGTEESFEQKVRRLIRVFLAKF